MKIHVVKTAFSFYERYEIKTESGEILFRTEGSFITNPKKITILNTENEPVGSVERMVTLSKSSFMIQDTQRKIILNEGTFSSYTLENLQWCLNGRMVRHIYELIYGDTLIMQFHKKWFRLKAHYVLDVEDEQDTVLALGILLSIKRNKLLYSFATFFANFNSF